MSVTQMARYWVLCPLWSPYAYDAQMHTLYCLNTLFRQSQSQRGLFWSVSLYSWRVRCFDHYTEQDWNLMMICSRMHVSIIADLMRTRIRYSHAYTTL